MYKDFTLKSNVFDFLTEKTCYWHERANVTFGGTLLLSREDRNYYKKMECTKKTLEIPKYLQSEPSCIRLCHYRKATFILDDFHRNSRCHTSVNLLTR